MFVWVLPVWCGALLVLIVDWGLVWYLVGIFDFVVLCLYGLAFVLGLDFLLCGLVIGGCLFWCLVRFCWFACCICCFCDWFGRRGLVFGILRLISCLVSAWFAVVWLVGTFCWFVLTFCLLV